jgi:tetratricopeptide (TPR) repeat protein
VTRFDWLLVAVVVVELAVGGYLAARRLARASPPVPDLALFDPATADDIRSRTGGVQSAEDWAKLGEAYLASGYFPEGEACYRVASGLRPSDADLAFKHGFALERLGRPDEANARYRNAIDRGHPRAADAWYYVGRNYLRLEQAGPAADAFAKAPDLPAARFESARLLARNDRHAEVAAEAERLEAGRPTQQTDSILYRTALLSGDRRTADVRAEHFLRRRDRLSAPFDVEFRWLNDVMNGFGRNRLGRAAIEDLQAGRYADAERKLREAQAAAWAPELSDLLAEAVFLRGRPVEAADILAEAVERGGPSYQLLWRLGQAYDAVGQPSRGQAALERAVRIATGPGAKDLYHDLATRYDRAGQREKARPLHARAYLAAGMEELDAGRPADAVPAFAQATEYDPRLAHAWYYLGEARRTLGQSAAAKKAYEQCLQLEPDHGRALRALRLLER